MNRAPPAGVLRAAALLTGMLIALTVPARGLPGQPPPGELAARGQSPSMAFGPSKSCAFHGSCTPGTSSLRCGSLFVHSLLASAGGTPPAGLPHAGRWEKEVAALERADRAEGRSGGIAFIGSSNIRLWHSLDDDFPGWHVSGRGVGGSHLHELVPVVLRLVSHSRPAVLVVSAGINDIHAGRSADQVATAFADLVHVVRPALPDTRIVFLAIAPSFARWDQREEHARANALIRAWITSGRGGPGLGFVDAGAAYLRPDGLPAPECFVEDGLHPTRLGYARRAAALRPQLEPFLVP